MKQLRTLHQAAVELKILDEKTALSEYRLRAMVKNGLLKSIMAGNRYLINMNDVLDFEPMQVVQPPESGKIRRVEAKR